MSGRSRDGLGRRRILVGLVAALVAFRLAAALAPSRPLVLGVPFGLVMELAVIAAATGVLWFGVRALLDGPKDSSRG